MNILCALRVKKQSTQRIKRITQYKQDGFELIQQKQQINIFCESLTDTET